MKAYGWDTAAVITDTSTLGLTVSSGLELRETVAKLQISNRDSNSIKSYIARTLKKNGSRLAIILADPETTVKILEA
jgi:hypothetical protein